MSLRSSTFPRSDIDDAVSDALRDLRNPDAVDAVRGQNFDLSSEEFLQIHDEIVEVVVGRLFELDEKIDIAAALLLAPRVRTEEPDACDRELLEHIVVLAKCLENSGPREAWLRLLLRCFLHCCQP